MLIEIRSLSAAECRIRTFMSIPLFPSGYKYFLGKSAGGGTKEPDGAGGGRADPPPRRRAPTPAFAVRIKKTPN